MSGKNPIEKALEKAKGLKEFIQQPSPLSNEERQVAKGDLKLISGWLKSALTTSPENAKHLKDASDMASELLQTIKNYSHFPSLLTERDRTLVPILQKQIQSKLDLVLKNMARLPPAFAAVKKEEDGKEEEEEEEEDDDDDVEVIVPQGQNKKPRTVLPDPTQSTTQGGFYHTAGTATGMGGPMPFFPGAPQYPAGPMYHQGITPGGAPYAFASDSPYAVASISPYAVASHPGILPHYHRGPPAPFPYQQALASYNNVTPNHQGYGSNGSRTAEVNGGPTFAATANAGPTFAASANAGRFTRGTAAKRGAPAAENGADPNVVATPVTKQKAFDWAQSLFDDCILRGDGVNKTCAPRLFRSINLCIPVLKNKEDLYQCLSHVGWGRDKMAGHFGLNAPAEDSLKQCLEEIGSVENIGGNKTNVLHVLMAFLEGWLKLNRPGHAAKSNPGTVQGKKDYTLELMMLAFVDENPK